MLRYVVMTGYCIGLMFGAANAYASSEIIVSEAVRTPTYLPVYHAIEKGYFGDMKVTISTAGTASAAFSSMLRGDAAYALADPMYVPIANASGGKTQVIAQIAGRIALWATTANPNITIDNLTGKTIATHTRPMTAYTYTQLLLNDKQITPDKVTITEHKPGSEIIAMLNGQADIAVGMEPGVSTAEQRGARTIYSFAEAYGERVFSGLMTSQHYIDTHPDQVKLVMHAIQKSLADIQNHDPEVLRTAQKYLSQIPESTLQSIIKRLTDEHVFPASIIPYDNAWDNAMATRVAAGDVKATSPLSKNAPIAMMRDAIQ